MKIAVASRAVAASTGRLFQLAIVRGRKGKDRSALFNDGGAEKRDGGCGESVSQTA